MDKKCIYCGAKFSPLNKWHEAVYTEQDWFGMACSEPGVPTTTTVKGYICDFCNDEAEERSSDHRCIADEE